MASAITCSSRILILVLVAISLVFSNARNLSKEEYLKIKRQLKIFNKPAVTSIKTEYGDIFDCVDVYKQPAFDHPLLKNHTIQMSPTSYPEGMENQHPLNANLEFGLKDGGCPLGTVPIRRTKMQELLRAKSLSDFGRKLADGGVHHYATASYNKGPLYGTGVTMNVWTPELSDDNEFSLAQLWVASGSADQLNTIEAGWTASPLIYGNALPRLFVYWTADGYKKTGCYNLVCPGFVQVSKNVALGSLLQPSTYKGAQKEITLRVFKDPHTGNWWLTFGNNNVQVGYWPKSIFTSLTNGASGIVWGGEVATYPGVKSPQMGSGHFPDEGLGKACYMKKMQYVDSTNTYRDIPTSLSFLQDVPQCYKVVDGGTRAAGFGRNIFFGGPGGC